MVWAPSGRSVDAEHFCLPKYDTDVKPSVCQLHDGDHSTAAKTLRPDELQHSL